MLCIYFLGSHTFSEALIRKLNIFDVMWPATSSATATHTCYCRHRAWSMDGSRRIRSVHSSIPSMLCNSECCGYQCHYRYRLYFTIPSTINPQRTPPSPHLVDFIRARFALLPQYTKSYMTHTDTYRVHNHSNFYFSILKSFKAYYFCVQFFWRCLFKFSL